MKSWGIEPIEQVGQHRFELMMPPELEGVFEATLWGRGPRIDASMADVGPQMEALVRECLIHEAGPFVAPFQVHGTALLSARRLWEYPLRPWADGVVLGLREFSHPFWNGYATLRFADCYPVVIAGTYPEPFAVLLHSGFRGTLSNIVAAAFGVLRRRGCDAESFHRAFAWVGPGVGACCYDRLDSDPLTARAVSTFPAHVCFQEPGRVRFDLREVLRAQLAHEGISNDRICISDACTCCDRDRCYSYRGGDEKKRMILIARLNF